MSKNIDIKFSPELPPKEIYNRAVEQFGIDYNDGVMFPVGDTIYTKYKMPPDLIVHELIHIKQQEAIGGWKIWWDKYFEDRHFRLAQEIQAYTAQFRYIKKNVKNKEEVNDSLIRISRDLGGSMYGNIINPLEVRKLLRNA